MKKYYVTVNGNRYEVEVEEVKGDFEANNSVAVSVEAPKAPVVTAAPAPAPTPVAAPTPKASVAGEKIECPMPGTILKINVNAGDSFKKGDVLFILEAMKMENEIMASRDGKILEIGVQKGAAVNTGDVLAVIQ